MFRTDFNISDDDFVKAVEPHNKAIDEYLRKNVVYDFIAYYIASGYKMDALWESSLLAHYNGALESMCGVTFRNEKEFGEIKRILKKKYKLIVVNEEPLQVIEKRNILRNIIDKYLHKKRT